MESKLVYSFFIILSFIIPFAFILLLSPKKDRKEITWLELTCFVCAIAGGVLYTVINSTLSGYLVFGLSSYGGAIGILIGLLISKRFIQIDNYKELVKKFILVIPLMYGISKLACFHYGCCRGFKYSGIFSVFYFSENQSYFPIQIVETTVFIIVFLLGLLIYKKTGCITWTILISAIAKLSVEPFRENYSFGANSIVSLIFIILAIYQLIYLKKRSNKNDINVSDRPQLKR